MIVVEGTTGNATTGNAPPILAPTRDPVVARDASDLQTISGLLEVGPEILDRARRLLTLLGDPGRRTVLELLSRRPGTPGSRLPQVAGMSHADIYHRLRSLAHGRVIAKNRHHIYRVGPDALRAASRYIDALAVAASLSARRDWR